MPEFGITSKRVEDLLRRIASPGEIVKETAGIVRQAEGEQASARRMREATTEVLGAPAVLPDAYWPALTEAGVLGRAIAAGDYEPERVKRFQALRGFLQEAVAGGKATQRAGTAENISTVIRTPGRLAGHLAVPQPSIEFLQKHRFAGPALSGLAAAADVPISFGRAAFQTPAMAEGVIERGPVATLKGLLPRALKEAWKGDWLEAAKAAKEDPVGVAAVALAGAGAVRGGAGLVKRGVRALTSAEVKRVATAANRGRWNVAGMPKKAVSDMVARLKEAGTKGLQASTQKAPKGLTRLQKEFIAAVEENRVKGVLPDAAMEMTASGFEPTAIQAALRKRFTPGYVEPTAGKGFAPTAIQQALAEKGVTAQPRPIALPGSAKAMAADPARLRGFAMRKRTEALRGLEEARALATEKMKAAKLAGTTGADKLLAVGEKAMKPAAENYNFWNNVVKRGAKRELEIATVERMGTGTAAHAPTILQQARTAKALGGAPPALEPLMRGTATRAAAVKELVPPGGGTGTAAVVPKRVSRQAGAGIEEILARTSSKGNVLSRHISERARMAGWSADKINKTFQKEGWTGSLSSAPENVKRAVLQKVEGSLAYTTAAGRIYRTVQRSLEKLGLKKQAGDLEYAYIRAHADATNNMARFQKLIVDATKEVGGDKELWAALDRWTPVAEAALDKGGVAKMVGPLVKAPPGVRKLVVEWVRHQKGEAVKKGLPLERRLEGYWPQKGAEQTTRIAPSKARTGYLQPEKRAPVSASLADYFDGTAREKYVRPIIQDVKDRFDKAGMLSPRASWDSSGLARDVMGALEGAMAASPIVQGQRAVASAVYTGILSAPASAGVNLTQTMNTAAQHGIIKTMKGLLAKTVGGKRATGGEAVARRLGIGTGKEHLLESTAQFDPTSRIGKLLKRGSEAAMSPFSKAEAFNKRTAFQVAYNDFKRQGMLPSAAKKAAVASVGRGQFWYGPAGTPMFQRKHPLLGQFSTYPVRQGTLMKDWLVNDPMQAIRYGASMYGIGKGLQAAGIAPEPILPFSPSHPLSWPPALRVGIPLAQAASSVGEPERAREYIGRAGQEIAGIARPVMSLKKALQEMRGQVRGPQGELKYDDTALPRSTRLGRAMIYAAGATPEAHAGVRRAMSGKTLEKSEIEKRRHRYAVQIADLELGNLPMADRERRIYAIYDEAGEYAPSYEMMKAEMRRREIPSAERQQMSLPRMLRD